MDILQTLITALTTPNEASFNFIGIFYRFIENFITMLFFTTVLNIKATKKQKFIFVLSIVAISTIYTYIIPHRFIPLVQLITTPILIILCLKATILRSIVAEILSLVVIAACETVLIRIYTIIFNISYLDITTIPIYRLTFPLFTYSIFYSLYKLCKHFNFNISILDNMNKRITIASILGVFAIIIQMYLVNFYNDALPLLITILGTLCSIIYFCISVYSLTRTTKLEITTQNLQQEQQYNKSLKILHDNLRAFKHDFGNIIQAIGGYVSTNDMKGFTIYYNQLLEDCQKVNNLSALSPDIINNPAIYSILATKYFECDSLGIKINLDIFLDLNTLNAKVYEFTRILGILMDNAIEAATECNEKIINVEIRKDPKVNRQLLVVENTYNNKNVNIDDIFKKNYTSKPNHSGIGLWEVNQILNKNTNLALYTTKNETFFKQQFEIYEN